MPGPSSWAEDTDSRFDHTGPAALNVPDIPTMEDALWICEEIKKMYLYIRDQIWFHEVRALYDPLSECVNMLYVDDRKWQLKKQSDGYTDVMTRVKEYLKQGYLAYQTQKRVYFYMPYNRYVEFVYICHKCGHFVQDSQMKLYSITTEDIYKGRQIRERPIIDLEDKLKDAEVWRDIYKRHFEAESEKNQKLKEQIGGQNHNWREIRGDDKETEKEIRKLSNEVDRLNTEIQSLMTKHSEEVKSLKNEIENLKQQRSQNTDPEPEQNVKPRRRWFDWRGTQSSRMTILLADLSQLSDCEHAV